MQMLRRYSSGDGYEFNERGIYHRNFAASMCDAILYLNDIHFLSPFIRLKKRKAKQRAIRASEMTRMALLQP